MDDPVCLICKKSEGGEFRRIQRQALTKLIESSKKRRDQKYRTWENLNSATIHRKCSDLYNRDSAIATAAADVQEKVTVSKNIFKNASTFDFQSLCFFLRGVM